MGRLYPRQPRISRCVDIWYEHCFRQLLDLCSPNLPTTQFYNMEIISIDFDFRLYALEKRGSVTKAVFFTGLFLGSCVRVEISPILTELGEKASTEGRSPMKTVSVRVVSAKNFELLFLDAFF